MIAGVTNTGGPGNTFPCPYDNAEAKLILVFSARRKPMLDGAGNRQYYCLVCHLQFSVNRAGQVVSSFRPER